MRRLLPVSILFAWATSLLAGMPEAPAERLSGPEAPLAMISSSWSPASSAEAADASDAMEICTDVEPEILAAVYPKAPPTTLLLMPFDNLTGVEDAAGAIAKVLGDALKASGWKVVDGTDLAQTFEDERVRYFDSLPASVRTKVLESSGAGAVLTGAVYAYSDGRNPAIAISARLVRADGTLAWANAGSITSADTERAFGFGRLGTRDALLPRAVDQLLARFPAAGEESVPVAGVEKGLFKRGAVSYRAPDVDPMSPQRVCVLPFENNTDVPYAARIAADLLSIRLPASTGFDIVEPALVREVAANVGIGSFRTIDTASLARMAPGVGTSLFLKGTVYEYVEPGRSGGTPAMSLEVMLIDVQEGRVIWSAQHEKQGDEYAGLLMLGAVSSPVALADRVVAEMIEAGKKASPAGEAATTARGVRRPPEKHSQLRGREKR